MRGVLASFVPVGGFKRLDDGETLDRLEYLTRDDHIVLVDEIVEEANGWRSHTWRQPNGAVSFIPWKDNQYTARARTQVDEQGLLVRFEPTLDNARHPEEAAYVPFAALNGCATVTHELDTVGRPVRSLCLGAEGIPVRSKGKPDGCYGWEWRPAESGHLHVCLGGDGQPAPSTSAWTLLEHHLDERGYKTDERYRDASGALTPGPGHIAERHYVWDDYGYLVQEGPFRAVGGAPFFYDRRTWGETRRFDDAGRIVRRTEIDPEGTPIADLNGVAITQWERDQQGRLAALRRALATGERQRRARSSSGLRRPTLSG